MPGKLGLHGSARVKRELVGGEASSASDPAAAPADGTSMPLHEEGAVVGFEQEESQLPRDLDAMFDADLEKALFADEGEDDVADGDSSLGPSLSDRNSASAFGAPPAASEMGGAVESEGRGQVQGASHGPPLPGNPVSKQRRTLAVASSPQCSGGAKVEIGGDSEELVGVKTEDRDTNAAVVGPQGEADDEESWEVEDGVEDIDRLPISPLSISDKLLAGQLFSSISRIRDTINSYIKRLGEPGWFSTFKLGTITALKKRLTQHEAKVISNYHAEVQVAYQQLVQRISALINLFKTLVLWNESKVADRLVDILAHISPLLKFLKFTSTKLADDLIIVVSIARFHKRFRETKSLSQAFEEVDVEKLHQSYANLTDPQLRTSSSHSAAIKQEVDVDEDSAKEEQVGGGDRARKKKRRLASTELAYDLCAAPGIHLAHMLKEVFKAKLFDMNKDLANDQKALHSVLEDFQSTSSWWSSKASTFPEAKESKDLLDSFIIVLQCSLVAEQDRPDTHKVRSARKVLLSACRSSAVAAAWSTCLSTYDAGKNIMQCARDHAAMSLVDDKTTAAYNAAVEVFDGVVGDACDNLDGWLAFGNAGSSFDLTSFEATILKAITAMSCDMGLCLDQWSSAALRKRFGILVEAFDLQLELVLVGLHLQLQTIDESIGAMINNLRNPQGDEAEGSGGHEGSDRPEGGRAETTTDVEVGEEVLSPVVATNKRTASSEDLVLLGQQALVSRQAIELFGARTTAVLESICKCFDRLVERLGQSVAEELGTRLDPHRILQLANQNTNIIVDACMYIEEVAYLMHEGSVAEEGAMEQSVESEYVKVLGRFCGRHRALLGSEGLSLEDESMCNSDSAGMKFSASVICFKADIGEECHKHHALSTISKSVDTILKVQVGVTGVLEEVAKNANLAHLLPLLIVQPTVQELCPSQQLDMSGRPERGPFCTIAHNEAHRRLADLAEIMGLETILLPGVFAQDGSAAEVVVQQALIVLKVFCRVHDIGIVAADLHTNLIELGSTKLVAISSLKGYLCDALHELRSMLCELESSVRSDEAIAVEREGLRLATSLSVVREWLKSMAIFSGACEKELLKNFVKHLEAEVANCRKAVPEWEAAFQGPEKKFNETLAAKLMMNKLGLVVRKHNLIHEILASMNQVARMLEITPKLPNHPISQAAVAVGLSTLASLTTASIICRGVELLTKFKDDVVGPSKAAEFLKEYQPKGQTIHQSFWHEFTELVNHAASPSPAAKRPRPSIKQEEPMAGSSRASEASTGSGSASRGAGTPKTAPSVGTPSPAKLGLKRLTRS